MTQSNNLKLNWWGWMYFASGYGVVNLEYATALERLTGGVSIGWERKTKSDVDWDKYSEEQKKLFAKPYTPERIGIIKTTPPLFRHNICNFRIGYTMVENTVVGPEWVKLCNQMDMIFVPSKFLIDVFRDSGVKVPIRNVKQGVNLDIFKPVVRKREDIFTFGTVGYIDDRKNYQALIQAFTSEFIQGEPVRLLIKNNNHKFGFWQPVDRRIKYINTNYSVEELTKFYAMLDCFVFPSRAEGAGMPPREAMATGLPTILTDWSGLSDIADERYNFPIKPIAIDVKDSRGPEQPGFQARLDIAELMYWMRYVYENYDEAMKIGKQGSDWIRKEYSWDACALNMLQILKEI